MPPAFPPAIDLGLQRVHVDGRRDRPVGVVSLRERCTEHGHDGVPDELHDGAGLAEDRVVHGGPVSAELTG